MNAAATPGDLLARCLEFVRALRGGGVATGPADAIELARALAIVDLGSPEDFRAAARTTLVHRQCDLAAYERIFTRFWQGQRGIRPLQPAAGESELSGRRRGARARPGEDLPLDPGEERLARYSDAESLAHRDLATLTDREVDEARRALRDLAAVFANRRSRRLRAARRGKVPDFRRLFRQAALRGGEVLPLPVRRPARRRARLLLLCDVSGSMEKYTRFLLELVYGLRRALPDAVVAVFATRLTVISDLLDSRNLRRSLDDVTARASGWGGGTDIGGCLQAFNRDHAPLLVEQDTVVVLLSDGWDRGDPAVMRTEMARLRRHAARIIWLNPLLGNQAYQPLTRGMLTALPHLDHFLPCHSLESLRAFTRLLARELR